MRAGAVQWSQDLIGFDGKIVGPTSRQRNDASNPKVVATYRRVSQHVDVAPVHSDQAFPQLPSFFTQSDVS